MARVLRPYPIPNFAQFASLPIIIITQAHVINVRAQPIYYRNIARIIKCRAYSQPTPRRSSSGWSDVPHPLALVPARGKSYISKKIYRYLNWLGFNTQVFNIGNYRRKYMSGTTSTNPDNDIDLTVDFFNQENEKFTDLREKIATMVVDDLIEFLNKPDNIVAILDGTNTTPGRRKSVSETFNARMKHKYQLIWI